MDERTGVTSFNGRPVTLLGPELKVGDQAPAFRVVDTALTTLTLADFKGKTKIICTIPSIDTTVCDKETRRFNQEAAQLSADIVVLTISIDLPFALQRWCAGSGMTRVTTLSDYQDRSFAAAYGVMIKELQLLSRSIFVIDAEDIIRYIQHVPEIGDEPDYAAVLAAAKGEVIT